jgi:hypothetical protein
MFISCSSHVLVAISLRDLTGGAQPSDADCDKACYEEVEIMIPTLRYELTESGTMIT